MKRHGFTLLEAMFAVALLAFIAVLVPRVLHQTFEMMRIVPAAVDRAGRFDDAVRQLRHDAWAAQRILYMGRDLTLVTPDGMVHWRAQDGQLQRTDPLGQPATWRDLAPQLRFEQAPAGLSLTWPDGQVLIDTPSLEATR